MLINIGKNILLLSLAGSILTLLLLTLKPFTKKIFSPNWQYYIWLPVLIIMILPLQIPLTTSNLDFTNQNIANESAYVVNENQTSEIQTEKTYTKNNDVTEINQQTTPIVTPNFQTLQKHIPPVKNILALLWLTGFLITLLYKISRYLIFLNVIKKNSCPAEQRDFFPSRLKLRITTLSDAPIIIGLLKPTLYLPQTITETEDLKYVFKHELIHYKRHDLIYKWLAMFVCSIHWFNPLAYLIKKQIDEECEISCDYMVTKDLSNQEKNYYMKMILELLSKSSTKPQSLTTQMTSCKKILKRRFTMIKNIKQTSKAVTFFSILIATLLFTTTAFASGILQYNNADDYKITIYNDGQKISFINQPFIENNTLYVPFREMLNYENINNKNIIYKNGLIQFKTQENGNLNSVTINSKYGCIGNSLTNNTEFLAAPILKNNIAYVPYDVIEKLSLSGQNIFQNINPYVKDKNNNQPKLAGTKYIDKKTNFSLILPLSWCGKYTIETENNTVTFYQKDSHQKFGQYYGMLFYIEIIQGSATPEEIEGTAGGRQVILQTDQQTFILGYPTDLQLPFLTNQETGETYQDPQYTEIYQEYDEMAQVIENQIIPTFKASTYENPDVVNTTDPSNVTKTFFKAFADSDYTTMKQYCTSNCIENFFHDKDIFGIQKAELINMDINDLEYAKSSNGFNILVTVKITPAPFSVYAPDQNTATFYVQLLRQNSGNYLIDNFVTGL